MEPTSKTPGTGRNKPQPVEGGDVGLSREAAAPRPLNIDYAVEVPLRAQNGTVVAFASVSVEDAALACSGRWHRTSRGYAARRIPDGGRRRVQLLHRAVLGLPFGDPRQGDHENRDRLDCRRSNLRVVTPAGNSQNRGSHSSGSSRFRGVAWDRDLGRWRAYGGIRGRRVHIGVYDDEEAAGAAARQWRAQHMPFSSEATR